MTDERKNQAGESERTSILPEVDDLRADRTEELPASTPLNETTQMPAAHADPVPAYRAPTEESARGREPEARGDGQAQEGRAPWIKRVLVAVVAVALLSVGFGAGMITHASIVGDGQDYYDQGYQDGYFDRGDEEDEEWESDENGGPGQDERGPGSSGEDPAQGDNQDTRPGPPGRDRSGGASGPRDGHSTRGDEDPSAHGNASN
ncbi:MAG: hypothetical protein ACFN4K_02785 [Pauljensenia sp.]